jgi:hypothetical protein
MIFEGFYLINKPVIGSNRKRTMILYVSPQIKTLYRFITYFGETDRYAFHENYLNYEENVRGTVKEVLTI